MSNFFKLILSLFKGLPINRENKRNQVVVLKEPPLEGPSAAELSSMWVKNDPKPIEVSTQLPSTPQPTLQKNTPWIYPNNSNYIEDPDGGKELLKTKDNKPIGIVIHHTATYNLNATVAFFKSNEVDVHFIIGHDGKVVQMVPCNKTAAHAGVSEWNGKKFLNGFYLGIEVVNIGWLTKKGDTYYDGYKREWKGKVRERNVHGYKYWEPFTDEQEKALIDLCVWLVKEYNIPIGNVAAHFEVSPGRKNDPAGGLSMTMDQLRKMVEDRVSQS